ncbi:MULTISPECIES: histidine kinase [unclassified Streptomyces]|uniref:sensor histidine kinase n=1 Tax=unclassified Streptomyces TaxID=2593676 RepID=UPI0006FE27A0|nr:MULTISPECIES: histidine kinase [unclassified Streptomyces]KQX59607.1 histidine kinase [Streptomyces sp. Root1304]KRB00865.1 histidine kinase [Streptomyces sp. Root66D1]
MTTHTTGTTGLSGRVQHLLTLVRAADARRPWIWDAALTLFWTGAALVDASGGWRTTAPDPTVPTWLVVVLSLCLALPLFLRRRRPMAVLTVMACAALGSAVSGAFLQAVYLQLIPLFHLALVRRPRTLLWALALLLPPLVTGAVLYPRGSWDQHVVPTLSTYALVSLLGIVVRSRRDHTAALVDRARRLEIVRDQEIRLAAAAERTRIAREMHDIIGHNLSVITGLADGGRYAAAKSPERAAQALDAIGTTSREALAELRRLLGVLRDDEQEAARDPQPTLADLDTLITGVRKAGLPVRYEAHDDVPNAQVLPPGAQLTVYRVIQEALTNTLKHAGEGAKATVLLTYTAREARVEITNTSTRTPAPASSPGQGLTGMRERAALYDGTLDSGPLPAGGWQVRLRLPREDSPS